MRRRNNSEDFNRRQRQEREAKRNQAYENRQRERLSHTYSENTGNSDMSRQSIYGDSFQVSYQGQKRKYVGKILKKLLKVILTICIILIILAGVSYGLFRFFIYGKMNYQNASTDYKVVADADVDADSTVTVESEKASQAVKQLQDTLQELSSELKKNTGTYNILLIGVDRRDSSWYGNSDVMILVTVNFERDTIYMTSFMRDLYADIPEVGIRKLNAACAYGGANLTVKTIRENYGVQIDNYAMVDFQGMIGLVDALGGLDLELTEEEIAYVNNIAASMASANGEDPSAHQISGTGLVHLDGYTATAYARNRSTGGTSDFGRTDRQRKVLDAIFQKASARGIESSLDFMNAVLPFVSHDIKQSTMLNLTTKLPSLLSYEVEQLRVPFDDEYTISNEILIPTDFNNTITKIRNTIY